VDDVLREIGERRAAAFNDARTFGHDDFSRGKVGNVNAVALDRQTGQIVEGWNGHSRDVIPVDRVHPLLAERLEQLRTEGPYDVLDKNGKPTGEKMPFPHPDNPLGHAEVKAVNELLWRRGTHADASVFEEFQVDNFTPFTKKGIAPIPCCANCGSLLAGTPATPGRLGGFPPEHFPRYAR